MSKFKLSLLASQARLLIGLLNLPPRSTGVMFVVLRRPPSKKPPDPPTCIVGKLQARHQD